ncbi:hypothetical protein BDR26DRAFT_1011089 [Obelidium mucronatum]|nr:hypothetical protein BDR26DRAFT_1011089 [Obelidium mucronatum]
MLKKIIKKNHTQQMIYVFIVDTSASMNQVFSHGLSYLDCAKGGIEHFFQWEQRRSDRHGNKYALIDYSDPPTCFKAGLQDTIPQLLQELKRLTATDISNPGQAFNAAFDYLNAYRYQTGLETPGKGRYFSAVEPTVIMWFTDGGNFSFIDHASNKCIVQNRLQISGLRSAGAAAFVEPFRWDQKLHTFLLSPEGKLVHPEVAAMSSATHSDVYAIWTKDHMKRCIENCMGAHKPPHPDVFPQTASVTQPTVWMQMEELQDTPNKPRKSFKLNVFPQSDQNTFPLPESYAVDSRLNVPPVRSSIPQVTFSTQDMLYTIPHGFPYDRFNIEQGPFKQLLARKAGTCWTLYVRNSGHSEGLGDPIGFLKVSNASRGSGVMMYIMPYNFPKLFKLIEHLNKNPSMKSVPPASWTKNFRAYLTEIPPYYHGKLRTMMGKIGLEHLLPVSLVPDMNEWPISKFLKTVVDQAKLEFDKYVTSVVEKNKAKSEELRKISLENAQTVDAENLVENAFDVSRGQVLLELKLLQTHFNKASQKGPQIKKMNRNQDYQDALHSVPISEMSNHHSKPYIPPLRNPFESDDDILKKSKRDPFGNPWTTKTKNSTTASSNSAAVPEDDEISNEASLMSGSSDEIADAAKKAADLENAALHSRTRKLARRRNRSNSVGSLSSRQSDSSESVSSSSSSSSSAAVGPAPSTIGSVRTETSFVLDRVPSLVNYFPVLVLPPPYTFQEVESGSVDILGWVEKVRANAQAEKLAADEAERVKKMEAVAKQTAASVEAWRLESANGGGGGVAPMTGVQISTATTVEPPVNTFEVVPQVHHETLSTLEATLISSIPNLGYTHEYIPEDKKASIAQQGSVNGVQLPKGVKLSRRSSLPPPSNGLPAELAQVEDFDSLIAKAFNDAISVPTPPAMAPASTAATNFEGAPQISRSSSVKRTASGQEISASSNGLKPDTAPHGATAATTTTPPSMSNFQNGEPKRQRIDPRLARDLARKESALATATATGPNRTIPNTTQSNLQAAPQITDVSKNSLPTRATLAKKNLKEPSQQQEHTSKPPQSRVSIYYPPSSTPSSESQVPATEQSVLSDQQQNMFNMYTPDFSNLLPGYGAAASKPATASTASSSSSAQLHKRPITPTSMGNRKSTPTPAILPFNSRLWGPKDMPKVPYLRPKGAPKPKYDKNYVCLHFNITHCNGGCGFEHVCAVCAKKSGERKEHKALSENHPEYFA